MKIKFTIPMRAEPRREPLRGKHGMYPNKKNVVWYEKVRYYFQIDAHPDDRAVARRWEGDVFISVLAVQKIHSGLPKEVKAAVEDKALVWKRTTPDGDNILKAIGDALNGLAYVDDKQLQHLYCFRVWGDEDRVDVTLHYGDASEFLLLPLIQDIVPFRRTKGDE